ncbi:MAG: hypothetical protein IPJ77_00695 [Planctomycetes bacterium]|nr:hypothetical protein [Planctomycetota bacterium]
MTNQEPRRARILAFALLWALAATPAVRAQDEAPVDPPEAALSADPVRNQEILRLAQILRLSRRADSPIRSELVRGLVANGGRSIEALLDLLESGRVPKVAPDDGRQVLSEAQRELVLAALGELDPLLVRAAGEQRLSYAETTAVYRTAVWALCAGGNDEVLERFLRRSSTRGDQPELPHVDWRRGFQLLFTRTPGAFAIAERFWREGLSEQQRALVEACGELRDPACLAFLASVLEFDRGDLATLAVGQIVRVGRSYDPALDERLGAAIRPRLDLTRPNACQAALQALGELRDRTTLALATDLLHEEDAGIRQSALWMLRRASGLELDGKPATWKRWLDDQERTFATAEKRILPNLASKELARVVEGLRDLSALRIERAQIARWIEPVLKRSEPGLRVQACHALLELDERSSVGMLQPLLEDRDARVVAAARTALTKLTGRDVAAAEGTAVAKVGSTKSRG